MDLRSQSGDVLLSLSYSRPHAVDHNAEHRQCKHSTIIHSISKQIKCRDSVFVLLFSNSKMRCRQVIIRFKRPRSSLHKKSRQKVINISLFLEELNDAYIIHLGYCREHSNLFLVTCNMPVT